MQRAFWQADKILFGPKVESNKFWGSILFIFGLTLQIHFLKINFYWSVFALQCHVCSYFFSKANQPFVYIYSLFVDFLPF